MPATTTWQEEIADAARPTLAEGGACVVRLGTRQAPQVASRLYKRSDYQQSRKLRQVAWARATTMRNEDMEANFYVVTRDTAGLTVWNGLDCMFGGCYPAQVDDATIYAVCTRCAHVEPRPERAAEDWSGCENCPATSREVERHDDPDIAEDASEIVLANNADDMARRRSGGDASIDARYA